LLNKLIASPRTENKAPQTHRVLGRPSISPPPKAAHNQPTVRLDLWEWPQRATVGTRRYRSVWPSRPLCWILGRNGRRADYCRNRMPWAHLRGCRTFDRGRDRQSSIGIQRCSCMSASSDAKQEA